MKLGTQGAALIKFYEGLRLSPYNDSAGNATIGYGHLIHSGPVNDFDRQAYAGFTKPNAETLFAQDTAYTVNWINDNTPHDVHLTQGQFDALVSFAYNEGLGNLKKSTLWKDVCANNFLGAEAQFAAWNLSGGKVTPGLVTRRAAEAALFAESAVKKNLPFLLAIAVAGWMCWKFFLR